MAQIFERDKSQYILPVLALVMSGLALPSVNYFANIPALIVSIIGISAGILFFINYRWFNILIQIWIYSQLPMIYKTVTTTLQNGNVVEYDKHVFNAGQFATFGVGFNFGTDSGEINIELNLVPFVLFFLYSITQTVALIGKRVTIYKYRDDNRLGDIFPLHGRIERKVKLGGERYWLFAELDDEFMYDGTRYKYLLLRAKSKEPYKPGKRSYFSYARLVSDPDKVGEVAENKNDFPFIDWVIVQVHKEKNH